MDRTSSGYVLQGDSKVPQCKHK